MRLARLGLLATQFTDVKHGTVLILKGRGIEGAIDDLSRANTSRDRFEGACASPREILGPQVRKPSLRWPARVKPSAPWPR